jgi:hypothetical protein
MKKTMILTVALVFSSPLAALANESSFEMNCKIVRSYQDAQGNVKSDDLSPKAQPKEIKSGEQAQITLKTQSPDGQLLLRASGGVMPLVGDQSQVYVMTSLESVSKGVVVTPADMSNQAITSADTNAKVTSSAFLGMGSKGNGLVRNSYNASCTITQK